MRTISFSDKLALWTTTGLLLLVARPVLAGPPYLTDDPEPVDYQHSEFYIASQITKTADGTQGTLPHIEYNYGFAPDFMAHVIIPYAFNDPSNGASKRGLGDIELGVKYRFYKETDSIPMAGIFPLVVIPTGDEKKGLGNGSAQVFLPLWLQKNWGDWQTNFGGGYWINNAVGAKDYWFFGWQIQKSITEHLTLGGELYYSTEQMVGRGSSSGFNLGGIYDFDEHNHLLVSVGAGLSNISATNEFSSYVGYQWTW
ncbi:MAG: transporter [Desulfocapsaceae bacterium]|nr:transporter [Desulfocapsaceae bacterium]